jgi:hypothetical protein
VTIGSTSGLQSGSLAASIRPTSAGATFGSLSIQPIGAHLPPSQSGSRPPSRRWPPLQIYPPGGRHSRLLGTAPDVWGTAADSLPSDWIGCRGRIWGAAGGDAQGARDVGHGVVDGDASCPVPGSRLRASSAAATRHGRDSERDHYRRLIGESGRAGLIRGDF